MSTATDPADITDTFARRTRVDPDGCWLWTGAATSVGYGVVRLGGRLAYAHRVALHAVGRADIWPGADGDTVDHLCCRKRCVNPKHMEIVTRAENSRRRWARVRLAVMVAA